jgi:hypothetical protein
MKHPGRWAQVKTGLPSTVHQTANALRVRQWNIPPGEWEFTVRTFRRGVHVGDLNIASLYARYIGPDEVLPYTVAQDAQFDVDGYRVCPECNVRLQRPERGPWPKKCDACWAKVKSKWARRRATKRSSS